MRCGCRRSKKIIDAIAAVTVIEKESRIDTVDRYDLWFLTDFRCGQPRSIGVKK